MRECQLNFKFRWTSVTQLLYNFTTARTPPGQSSRAQRESAWRFVIPFDNTNNHRKYLRAYNCAKTLASSFTTRTYDLLIIGLIDRRDTSNLEQRYVEATRSICGLAEIRFATRNHGFRSPARSSSPRLCTYRRLIVVRAAIDYHRLRAAC